MNSEGCHAAVPSAADAASPAGWRGTGDSGQQILPSNPASSEYGVALSESLRPGRPGTQGRARPGRRRGRCVTESRVGQPQFLATC
eukprot:488038-Hanusia_phi.AAC.2